MRYSSMYIPTQKEAPQDAEAASHKLLARAGYIRKSGAGSFILLPLGSKVLNRLVNVAKNALSAENFQEVHHHSDDSGKELFRLLGSDLISYKQLPKKFFGISEVYNDSIRPRLGLLYPKAFRQLWGIMLCSSGCEIENRKTGILKLFEDFFGLLNIKLEKMESVSLHCCRSEDINFFAPYEAGEHTAVMCPACKSLKLPDSYPCGVSTASTEDMLEKEKVYTPKAGTIDEITKFLNCTPEKLVKTLLYTADGKVVAALIRGDRELSEVKLKELLGCTELTMADYEIVKKVTGAEVGFAGPVGLEALIVADSEVLGMRNFVVGANCTDHHLVNVNIGRDFKPEKSGDIRCAAAGDTCSTCGSNLEFKRGFLIGGIRLYDQKYMDKLGLLYRNEQGSMDPMEGLYFNFNLYSLAAIIVEQNHDEAGIQMPGSIAPFDGEIVVVNVKDEFLMSEAGKVYKKALDMGMDILLDDRDERAGVKFKDCELIGIPARITVGKRMAEGIVEYKAGRGEVEEMTSEEALARLKGLMVLTRQHMV